MRYAIIQGSADDVGAQVNEMIGMGWVPIGGISVGVVLGRDGAGFTFAQALTREDAKK